MPVSTTAGYRKTPRILPLVFLVALAAAVTGAEDTGSLRGLVTDVSDRALPECEVSVASADGREARFQETGPQGAYSLAGLPVGLYRVSFRLSGYEPLDIKDVAVEMGARVSLHVVLDPLGTVRESSHLTTSLRRRRSGLGETLDRSELGDIPSGRSLWTVLETAPGLVSATVDVGGSAGGQQVSFSATGTSSAQNRFTLNGVDVTDPSALGASSTYYSYDSFEEVQVSTAGLPADVPAPGVLVQVVTRSGSNRFTGGAAFYFENATLQSDNLDDRLRAQGVSESNRLDRFRDLNVDLGGPIVRDRAFFHLSYARQSLDPFVIGFFLPTGEPGIDSTDLSTVTARGTFSLGTSSRLGLFFHRNDKLRPYRDAGRSRPEPATTLYQDSKASVYQLRYSQPFGETKLVDARFGLVGLDFPLGENPELPPDSFSRIDLANSVRSGGPGANELFDRRRYQANGTVFLFRDAWLSGSHDLKLGWATHLDSARTRDDLNGAIVYRDLFGAPLQVEIHGEPLTTENRVADHGLFLEDAYVRGRMALDLGLRIDWWIASYPDQARTAGRWDEFFSARGLPRTTAGRRVGTFASLVPRLSFTCDLTTDGRNLLRGGYARYAHPIGTGLAGFANPNGPAVALFRFDDRNGNRVVDAEEIDLDAPLSVGLPTAREIDPGLAPPLTDEALLGVERELGRGFAVAGTLIYRRDHRLIDDVNVGVPPSEFVEGLALDPGRDLAVGTGDDGVVPVFNQSQRSLGHDRLVLENPSGLSSRYRAVVLELRKRDAGRWWVSTSLTLGESEGYLPGPGLESAESASSSTPLFDNPNTHTNAYGRTFWDRPRIFRLASSFEWKWGLRFAGTYRYQVGQPLYRSIVVGATSSGALLNQGSIEILAESQGSLLQPDLNLVDLRAEKALRFGKYGELDLVFDLFNALNAATPTAMSSRGGAFGAILAILPPRIARIGVRYRFGSGR